MQKPSKTPIESPKEQCWSGGLDENCACLVCYARTKAES